MTLSLTPYDDDDSNGPDDDDDNDDDDSTRPDDDDDNDDDSTRPTLGGLRPPLHFNPIFHHFLPNCTAEHCCSCCYPISLYCPTWQYLYCPITAPQSNCPTLCSASVQKTANKIIYPRYILSVHCSYFK